MSATASLKELYHFPGWIIDNIDLNLALGTGDVFLRQDARKKRLKSGLGHPWQSGLGHPSLNLKRWVAINISLIR
ncbi:hypothetical protein [sulfur-oxidizing endosymbiont of Gigantopelta aegis]|uniref:hypothetical protein n=1 Tax=sulfur-oxidizing endosymbiont of Gigantopelta aegis TaxID=2794934 RepID=UPI0018DE2785|nr:hypothetical protein [sulfur-oxidizing endosymbiont of Gigantopelta aegis]